MFDQLSRAYMLNQRLENRAWIMGDAHTIADIATFPWVRNLIKFYEAGAGRVCCAAGGCEGAGDTKTGVIAAHKRTSL